MVDNAGRANPFFGEGGGLTWINQNQSFSYYNRSGRVDTSPILFMAEAFLAQDVRTTDAAGRQIVNIFGGIKSGWKMDRATT